MHGHGRSQSDGSSSGGSTCSGCSSSSSSRALPGWAPLLSVLVLLAAAGGAAGQQLTPFQGRNRPPAGGVDVYVSAVVDHIVGIDDANYRFEVVLYMLLTWRDARALPAVEAATKASVYNATTYNNGNGCAFPCTTIYAWQPNPNATNMCCDDIWLPHFEMINVRGFSQDRVERYGIRLGDNDSVAWWAHIQGEMYTPLQFRSFPFDKQFLSIQLQYGNKYPEDPVRIVPSATGTQLYSPNSGDKISGWSVKHVYIKPINLQQEDLLRAGASTPSAAGDPWPLSPANSDQPGFQGYLWQNGCVIYIEVNRISNYYIITAILPICINTLLALLVFSVSPRHLDTRLGIVVTLFLSLTALQYVIAAGLPSSSTVVPTQQLIIVSYCILAGVGVSSIVVFWMVSLHHTRERQRRLKRARRAFTSRWHSLTSSLGFAVTAGIVTQQRGGRAGSGSSAGAGSGAGGSAGFAAVVALSLRNKAGPEAGEQGQRQQQQQGQQQGPGTPAGVTAAAPPPSPVATPAGRQEGPAPQPASSCSIDLSGSASQLPELPLVPAGSAEVAVRRQLAGQNPRSATLKGPQTGGMGVYAGSSAGDGSSLRSGDEGGSSEEEGEDGQNSLRTREPLHAAGRRAAGAGAAQAARADQAPAAAADEEEAGGGQGPEMSRRWARWRRRALCCCRPQGADGGAGHGANGGKPNCFKLLWLKLRLIKEEMRDSQDFAMVVATDIDRHIFWATLCGFAIAVIVIFAVQAQIQPEPEL